MRDRIITWYLLDPQSLLHSVGLINFNVPRYTMIELGYTSTLSPPCQSVSSMTAPCICLNASCSDEKTAPSLTHWAGFTSFPIAFQVLLEQPCGVTWRRLENEYNPFPWNFPNPNMSICKCPMSGIGSGLSFIPSANIYYVSNKSQGWFYLPQDILQRPRKSLPLVRHAVPVPKPHTCQVGERILFKTSSSYI